MADTTRSAAFPVRSRVLCGALPLAEGDRLAVVGWSPNAVAAAREFGVVAVTLVVGDGSRGHAGAPDVLVAERADRLPLEDSAVDHVLVPGVTTTTRPAVPREIARVVRPGGSVLVVGRSQWRGPYGSRSLPVRRTMRELRSAGLEAVQAYGVRPDADDARFLIPLDSAAALRWYVHSFGSAATLRSTLLLAALPRVARRQALLRLVPAAAFGPLFPAVAFRAVRPGPTRRPW